MVDHVQHHVWFRLHNVSRWFGDQPGVQGVDFTVNSGDTIGLVGPNGSGKTTLLKLLSGHVPPTAGDLNRRTPEQDQHPIQQYIGYSGHELMLYEQLTLEENLNFFAGLYNQSDNASRIRDLLDELNLLNRRDARVSELSSGMKKKGSIARALVHHPALLLLDEPFRGVDAGSVRQIKNRLKTFTSAGGTLLLASHDLGKVYNLCQRVLMLKNTEPCFQADLSDHYEESFRDRYRQVAQS